MSTRSTASRRARKSVKDSIARVRRYAANRGQYNNNTQSAPKWLKGQLGTLRAKRTYIANGGSQYVSSNLSAQGLGLYFRLQDLSNYTEFTSLFDKYRIMWAKVTLVPKSQQPSQDVASSGAGTHKSATVVTAIDFDDVTAPTSLATVMEYDNCKVHTGDQRITRSFKPRVASAVYNGAFTGYAELQGDPWIDCGSAGVQYYGFKACMDTTFVSAEQSYDVYATLWIDFCNLN